MTFVFAAVATALTLLMAGGVAGLFYAFSVSVMPALDAIKPEQAVAAMQSVNHKIENAVFLSSFLLMPVMAVLAGVLLLVLGHRAAAIAFFAAAAVYVLGALVPTMVVNVPMNNTLAAAGTPADAHEAARLWAAYSPRWTWWNTLRTTFGSISLLVAGLGVFLWGRNG